jgi:hypothetical protein
VTVTVKPTRLDSTRPTHPEVRTLGVHLTQNRPELLGWIVGLGRGFGDRLTVSIPDDGRVTDETAARFQPGNGTKWLVWALARLQVARIVP